MEHGVAPTIHLPAHQLSRFDPTRLRWDGRRWEYADDGLDEYRAANVGFQ